MAIPVPHRFSGVLRLLSRGAVSAGLSALLGAGCSIMSPSSPEPEPTPLTSASGIDSLSETIKNNPNDLHAYNMRGAALAQAGKSEEALLDFNKAISLAPDSAAAYYNRGLLYQGEKQHEFAINDFTAAKVSCHSRPSRSWRARKAILRLTSRRKPPPTSTRPCKTIHRTRRPS